MDIEDLITAIPQAEKLLGETMPNSITTTGGGAAVREGSSPKELSEGELLRESARRSSGEFKIKNQDRKRVFFI